MKKRGEESSKKKKRQDKNIGPLFISPPRAYWLGEIHEYWFVKQIDMDKLADGLQKLGEDDLLQVVQMVHDNKTSESYTKNDVERRFLWAPPSSAVHYKS